MSEPNANHVFIDVTAPGGEGEPTISHTIEVWIGPAGLRTHKMGEPNGPTTEREVEAIHRLGTLDLEANPEGEALAELLQSLVVVCDHEARQEGNHVLVSPDWDTLFCQGFHQLV